MARARATSSQSDHVARSRSLNRAQASCPAPIVSLADALQDMQRQRCARYRCGVQPGAAEVQRAAHHRASRGTRPDPRLDPKGSRPATGARLLGPPLEILIRSPRKGSHIPGAVFFAVSGCGGTHILPGNSPQRDPSRTSWEVSQ